MQNMHSARQEKFKNRKQVIADIQTEEVVFGLRLSKTLHNKRN
jgi:hypothetical protein